MLLLQSFLPQIFGEIFVDITEHLSNDLSEVGNKFETFSCRSLGEARTCQITPTNRKKCQACRFSKCRSMGMTHTTLETRLQYPVVTTAPPVHQLTVKQPTGASLSPILEEPAGYSSDWCDHYSGDNSNGE